MVADNDDLQEQLDMTNTMRDVGMQKIGELKVWQENHVKKHIFSLIPIGFTLKVLQFSKLLWYFCKANIFFISYPKDTLNLVALKAGILVQKILCDLPEFKSRP